MKPLIELRKQAKAKRDSAIRLARREYEATVAQIESLERHIACASRRTVKPLAASIGAAIPSVGTFTTRGVMETLQGEDPARDWRKRSVEAHIAYLMGKGIASGA